jgi:hypothetical protein
MLLTDELAEVSERARAAAQRLADRIGDLGDVRSTTDAGLSELNVIIAAFEEFLVRARDTDPVSQQRNVTARRATLTAHRAP